MSNITIVGGGLVGSLLAIFLAKRGHQVSVYDRRGDPRKVDVYAGRSINLVVSHRGWTALRAAGVEEVVRAITVPVHARMVHDREGNLNRVPYSIDNKAIYSVSRGELNRRLLTEAEKLPNVKLFFDHRCLDVDLANAECIFEKDVTLSSPKRGDDALRRAQGDKVVVKADVVFGADGAFSAVRSRMMQGRFTYSQEYIEHDYKEVAFPANPDGTPKMDPHCLHIWPRRWFMMMGLANQDGGFTGTLFMPNTHTANAPGFDTVRTPEQVQAFFQEHFRDALPLIPDLVEQYLRNPQSSLVIIRCNPWQVNGKVALIGDAAHAIVPFYGEGMNAGYEDCKVLNDLLDQHGDDNWAEVLHRYAALRKPNGDAIADLSLRNFVEMRDLVADPRFLLRKKIEGHIQAKHPERWLPLYSQVKFSDIGYADAWREGLRHDRIMEEVLALPDIEAKWESAEVERRVLDLLASY
ncbi:MAG TPA: FAD-dependent monooxygenase [Flavobacteriales bacterium]